MGDKVERTDGKHHAGQKHDSCEYFVLDLTHDPFAIPALIAYAKACKEEYGLLSQDLERVVIPRAMESIAAKNAEKIKEAGL